MSNTMKLIISLAVPQLLGGLGALFTNSSIDGWYQTLIKPSWNPPGWLFGPMWILLYFLRGLACYLLWKSNSPLKKKLLTLYAIQLLLNGLWSPAFFGMESPLLGLSIIVPLWILIVTCVLEFRKANSTASALMIPYLLWVTFATMLNTAIWWLN